MSEIGLYIDEACSRPITRDEDGKWQIEFGRIDAGDAKAGVFFVKNRTVGVIENIQVTAGEPDKEGITAMIRPDDPNKTSLMPLEVMKLYMHLSAEEGISAGGAKVGLKINARLTEEEINPDAIA